MHAQLNKRKQFTVSLLPALTRLAALSDELMQVQFDIRYLHARLIGSIVVLVSLDRKR